MLRLTTYSSSLLSSLGLEELRCVEQLGIEREDKRGGLERAGVAVFRYLYCYSRQKHLAAFNATESSLENLNEFMCNPAKVWHKYLMLPRCRYETVQRYHSFDMNVTYSLNTSIHISKNCSSCFSGLVRVRKCHGPRPIRMSYMNDACSIHHQRQGDAITWQLAITAKSQTFLFLFTMQCIHGEQPSNCM